MMRGLPGIISFFLMQHLVHAQVGISFGLPNLGEGGDGRQNQFGQFVGDLVGGFINQLSPGLGRPATSDGGSGFFGQGNNPSQQGNFGQSNFGQGNFGQGNFGQGNFGQGHFGMNNVGQGNFGPGFFGEGGCGPGNGGCEQQCRVRRRRHQCFCNAGYFLNVDRFTCSEWDECLANNGGCSEVCTNTPGSFTCSCRDGGSLQLDGRTCSHSNTCQDNNGGCQESCTGGGDSGVQCSCSGGFILAGDGSTCTDVNECSHSNGGCEHTCTNTPGAFTCTCHPGFTLLQDGRCQAPEVAATLPPTAPVLKPPTATVATGCGINTKKSLFRRIVGGRPANPKDWPWMAALVMKTGTQYCGGTLITDRHVLTAAHCMKPVTASQFFIRLGEYDFSTNTEQTHTDFSPADIRIHEQYNTVTQENDIALIRMDRPAPFNEFVLPICLPPTGKNFEGDQGYVIGWGTTSFGGSLSNTLREVVVPVWTQPECETAYANKIKPTMMCAASKIGGEDSCQGDSGGPYLMQDARTMRWFVGGVVSWGVECARQDRPGVYTRVNMYLNWIKQNAVF